MILAKNYIENGFSINDAQKLEQAIQPVLENEEITIDFSEIKFFTTLFFNNVLGKYVLQYGPESYEKKFKITNLSEVGNTTYMHSLENAKDYYKLSETERENYQNIIRDENG